MADVLDHDAIRVVAGTDPSQVTFTIDDPVVDGPVLALHYTIATPTVRVPIVETITLPDHPGAPAAVPEFLVRLLALAAATSYYKAVGGARIEVPSGLTPNERDFLTRVLAGGLAEFAYRNQLPATLTPTIAAPTLHSSARPIVAVNPERALVAVGGGKDSIVALEAVRGHLDTTLFSVNTYAPILATAQASGLPLLTTTRTLDPALFALNDAGAPNGHVPVTAINSLIALATAARAGIGSVVFANESSASAGNLIWNSAEVNHQWSKGAEFEQLLQDQLSGAGLSYCSLLRPFTELAIMRSFAGKPNYLPVFTSCNRAFHLDPARRRNWCGDCPKCRFVYLCLAPFVDRPTMLSIFGRDLFSDPSQYAGFRDLLGLGGLKPFECVGEPEECRAALTLLRQHPDWSGSPFLAEPDLSALSDTEIEHLFVPGPHRVPAHLRGCLREVR